VCVTADEVIDAIAGYLSRDCMREEEYTRWADAFFAFRDRDNCARVTAAIDAIR
jgi:hypothetical protein